MRLKILIVDDSTIFRRVIAEALAPLPDVEVVGSAANGELALRKVRELAPDLLTLDMEMPDMSGLEVLDALQKAGNGVAVIVVSALTRQGGLLTMQALEKGAFDFITKPEAADSEANLKVIRREVAPRVRALAHRLEIRNILRSRSAVPPAVIPTQKVSAKHKLQPADTDRVSDRINRLAAAKNPEMVLIGVSTGGPRALAQILPLIPGDIGVPLLIVQHMPPVFTQSLAESLSVRCAIRVKEAYHGERVEPNTAYIAPGGRQMGVAAGPKGQKMIQITEAPPENNCRPAVDYLFRSVANLFPGQAMAVILTGMGSDGALGLRRLKRHGCYVIAQDEASCVVYGMPKAAVDAGVTDVVLSLEAIAARITATVRG